MRPSFASRGLAALLLVAPLLAAPQLAAPARAQEKPLPRSSPESQGIASRAILDFVRAADTTIDAMNGLVIVRHGRVVAEGWWAPYDARTPHVLYSLSKSFTSTAVGLAAAEGKLSLDDPVTKFFPEDVPARPSANLRAMRVRDLIRMNTGHVTEPSFWAPGADPRQGTDSSWVRRFFAHPVPFKPGTHFLYNSPATYMLSAIVQKTTGQTVLDFLRPRLLDPLGIVGARWVQSPEGVSAGGYGLDVRTEDIAKLGLLYLNGGRWDGRQLLPPGWAEEASARQTSNGSSPTSDWDQGYGYQFWRSRHGYRGDGAFGQYMLVVPEHDLVVAINSGVRDMQAVMNLVWTRLLPAMGGVPLAENAAAKAELDAALARLAVARPAGRAASPLAARVSGRWYVVADNERGVQAIRLDLAAREPVLLVRTERGETRTPIGFGTWARSAVGFANGIDRLLAVPEHPAIAASGAWSNDSTFALKLVAPETPFYSSMTFRFSGDRVAIESEHNVSFAPTRLPVLRGVTAGR